MIFTTAQQHAIDHNGNLIVSAAAGAGKTSVLSERVFRLVGEGMSVDRMLILTFTRAAAGEMKARITKRLLKAASEDRARAAYFREQAAAVPNANISTIDAFCSKIVFRHFFCAGLSPSCKTLDETEAEVLRSETRNAVLDDFAQNRAEEYRTLIIAFSDEPSLIDAMQSAERFLCAQPDPNGLHFSQASRFLPCMPYILADGPPRSERYPLKSGISTTCFTSFRILSFERQEMNFP